ncbi:MAG: HD domain-containing protein [Candidatus Brocadiia bacterium]
MPADNTHHPFRAENDDPVLTWRRYACPPDPMRGEFFRDYTRILHSRAFRRLRNKTQVFVMPYNDHICTRIEHTLLVCSVAKTICDNLGLNTDLATAIALGHDIGHAPFGHFGEECLKKVLPGFSHEKHSLLLADRLNSEKSYEHPGLNLTFAVRDGIACHYGEGSEQSMQPDRKKTFKDLDIWANLEDKGRPMPVTLEGCVVRMADRIAYIGRDLEDYLQLPDAEQSVPEEAKALGQSNREILGNLVADVIETSRNHGDSIGMSDGNFAKLKSLYRFSNDRIYRHPYVRKYFDRIDRAIPRLVEYIRVIIEDWQKKGVCEAHPKADLWDHRKVLADFLTDDVREWQQGKPLKLAIWFVAGMTDTYFVRTFNEVFVPEGL